jgi:adenosylhomocysteine nucleosidase
VSRVGLVVGMMAEAARVRDASAALPPNEQPLIAVAGGSGARAEALALAAEGVAGLMSFGLCGGLDPALANGDVVLADAVVTPDGREIATDKAWRDRVAARLERRGLLVAGAIAGRDEILASPRAKAALHAATGALAIDMESHGVARAAMRRGIPFLALRLVLDPADLAIPWAAQAGLGADGEARLAPVLLRLLFKPWELPALLALGRANETALDALGGLAADLAPLGFLMELA